MPGRVKSEGEGNQGLIGSHPGEDEGKRFETCKLLQIDVAIRKNHQSHGASKPQFFPPVPERGIIDPEKLRRLGFVPPRHEKGFPE